MTRDFLRTISAAAFALALLGGPAAAQTAFTDWDADASGGIDATEWNEGWNDVGAFDTWDADDDDMIGETEWREGIGDDETAFNERFGETAWTDWDMDDDAMLSEDEFGEGVFAGYDANEDDMIDETEFGMYEEDDFF